ncbi:hypothetical protein P344_02245 [Spiroplasma mirum ATCC 29335]|uniref:Transmembrane protein n=1 Tax=Spiroplasma mirum ATCC 29335 TaxID=838561 RepID=W0GKW8_9MOLU|nr:MULTISPECIES: hypothetical protein [Spiroplasma]AHF60822.1 putative transmembrane protein [Spiroplasma mirum ATCC 29335]AHI57797.1 hypothetical protein P344_02245 [Spiroplasma mirum ATCC 29335]AKM52933.1 hypothetical protein SATRI_v1c04270 [Spiroplasma atrichopogonis]
MGDIFKEALYEVLWGVFVMGPLQLINVFTYVLDYLSGGFITTILFGNQNNFDFNQLPQQFWIFLIIAIAVFAVIFCIQIMIIQFKEHAESKKKFLQCLLNSGKAIIFMFLIPIFFFVANFCIAQFTKTIDNSFGNKGSIADYLWHLGDPNWDGTINYTPSDYGLPDNILDYNMTVEIFGSLFMVAIVMLVGFMVIQKIIELFFLFIISPIVMITMVLDDGKKVFVWKDMVIAKFLASSSAIIGFDLFMTITHLILKTNLSGLDAKPFARQLLLILIICGGGVATYEFSNIINSLVGEHMGASFGLNTFRAMTGGLTSAWNPATLPRHLGKIPGMYRTAKKGHDFLMNSGDSKRREENDQARRTWQNANVGTRHRNTIPGLNGNHHDD